VLPDARLSRVRELGGSMQNLISTFSPWKSFQFVNEQLFWEQGSPHCHDCHGPPHAARVRFYDDRSPPRRLAAVARSDAWKTPPVQVGSCQDATRRQRLPWVVGSDLWCDNRGEDYLLRDRRDEDCDPEERSCALAALGPHLRPAAILVACRAYSSCFPGT
jgi:hypothetical protein